VFDIDPYIYSGKEAKGAEPELNKRGFAVGKRVAFWLRALLKQMSLEAIVEDLRQDRSARVRAIERTVTFDEARHICETWDGTSCVHIRRTSPWTGRSARTHRQDLHRLQHERARKTLNVAYSPRGVPGSPGVMPLSWEELEAAEPMDFTINKRTGPVGKDRRPVA